MIYRTGSLFTLFRQEIALNLHRHMISLVFCIIRHIVECIILHTWVGFIFMVIVLVVVMQIFEKVKEQLLKWTID